MTLTTSEALRKLGREHAALVLKHASLIKAARDALDYLELLERDMLKRANKLDAKNGMAADLLRYYAPVRCGTMFQLREAIAAAEQLEESMR